MAGRLQGWLWSGPDLSGLSVMLGASMISSLTVQEADRREVDAMIRERHYLKRWPGVCVCTLSLRYDGYAVGVIVFALPPRETNKRYGMPSWELARLWIDDLMPRNTESWFISRAIAHIRARHKDVACLVSYADPSAGHRGTVYMAASWIPDGRTDDERKSARCDYWVGDKKYSRKAQVPEGAIWRRVPRVSKFRFVYYLKDHERKRQQGAICAAAPMHYA